MAFKVWVRHVAPEVRPVRPWENVAVVWPREMRMEWVASSAIREEEPARSGARVASLMAFWRLVLP